MAVKSTALGPGLLQIGETGSLKDWSCQITKALVTVDVSRDDPIPTLCGDNMVGEATYTTTLEATFIQDLESTGIIAWSWANKGAELPINFVPNSVAGASITGVIVIDPIDIGGDVKKKNTSDVKWTFVGDPSLTWPSP